MKRQVSIRDDAFRVTEAHNVINRLCSIAQSDYAVIGRLSRDSGVNQPAKEGGEPDSRGSKRERLGI